MGNKALILYNSPRGTNTVRVTMYLLEKGIEVPVQEIDFEKEEHRSEAFRKKNPMAKLPVLELDDGTVIAESQAIIRYLEELHPEPPLLGRTPEERAVIEMWNRRIELDVTQLISLAMRHTQPFFAKTMTQVPEYAEACRTDLFKYYDWLNEELATREFLASDEFSVVDITGYCRMILRKVPDCDFKEEHTNLRAWHARIAQRPSAVAIRSAA